MTAQPYADATFDWSMYGRHRDRLTYNGPDKTIGDWQSEEDAAEAFDHVIDQLDMFMVYKEVVGRVQFFRPFETPAAVRIDRILVPNSRLRAAGWTFGPVGIEIKRSGIKIGRPLGQLIDYARSTFKLGNTWIVPEWFFMFPLPATHGPLDSVLASQRCGGVSTHGNEVTFCSSQTIAVLAPGKADIRTHNARNGKKVGSR